MKQFPMTEKSRRRKHTIDVNVLVFVVVVVAAVVVVAKQQIMAIQGFLLSCARTTSKTPQRHQQFLLKVDIGRE